MFSHSNALKFGLFFAMTFALPALTLAQPVKLKFGDINLGSETTTLVTNGDFEANGGNNSSIADGWARTNQMYVTSDNVGGLIPDYDGGDFVAKAHVSPSTINGLYTRGVTLAANTEYVLSAYIWNLSDPTDSDRQWNVNVDINGLKRIAVLGTDMDGDQGYFVYQSFTSAQGGIGTSPTLRVFYDVVPGSSTGWPQQPVGALWDRIAITPASSFVAPTAVPVPEPGSMAFCVLLGLGAIHRRRRL